MLSPQTSRRDSTVSSDRLRFWMAFSWENRIRRRASRWSVEGLVIEELEPSCGSCQQTTSNCNEFVQRQGVTVWWITCFRWLFPADVWFCNNNIINTLHVACCQRSSSTLRSNIIYAIVTKHYRRCFVDICCRIQKLQYTQEDLPYRQHNAQDLAKVWSTIVVADDR